MRHVDKALVKLSSSFDGQSCNPEAFITIENAEDIKGVAPVVKFVIQSDPISEVGVNGCQAIDMIKYVKCLVESLNEVYPCKENEKTIVHLGRAIHWQNERTKDRVERDVEGRNAL